MVGCFREVDGMMGQKTLLTVVVMVLISAAVLVLPSPGVADAPELTENSMADVYRDTYGWPAAPPASLPDWLVALLYERLGKPSVNYSGGYIKWPKTRTDATFRLLTIVPAIEDELAESPELRADMRKAVEYLSNDILLILALEVDQVSGPDLSSNRGRKEELLRHLDSLVRLARMGEGEGLNLLDGASPEGNPEWVFTGMATLKERGFTDYEPFAPEKWSYCRVVLADDGSVVSIDAPRWRVAAAVVSVLKLTPENRQEGMLDDAEASAYLARFLLEYSHELEELARPEFRLLRLTPAVSHLLVRALGRCKQTDAL